MTVRINWDAPAVESLKGSGSPSGHLEAFNGAVVAVRPLAGSDVTVDGKLHWTAPADKPGGIEADLIAAVNPDDVGQDRTIITVRTQRNPFSFAAIEAAGGERILVDDLGMLVTPWR